LQKVPVVVAARDIPARKPIEPDDLAVREVPLDATNGKGVVSKPDELIGRVLAVTVFQDQLVTTNLIASSAGGGGFSILGPGETVAPDSEAWRAVSITMADPSAVAGLLQAGETIDVFATATVNVPQELIAEGRYYTDRSTKLTYQNVVILARSGTLYVIRASISVAEELAHLSAAGNVTFSAALRPELDVRLVDASHLGATTNLIITRYGLPIPEAYPARGGAIATLPPLEPSPLPSTSPTP
jgi:Flp pilus assembly protein CpaB